MDVSVSLVCYGGGAGIENQCCKSFLLGCSADLVQCLVKQNTKAAAKSLMMRSGLAEDE